MLKLLEMGDSSVLGCSDVMNLLPHKAAYALRFYVIRAGGRGREVYGSHLITSTG